MTNEELWLYTFGKNNGLLITDIQLRQLIRYKELLMEWNKKINLVSRKDEENIWSVHIALSVSFLFKVEFPQNSRILDLGTGGGLPGIPLSILLPNCNFILLDSINKKLTAVQAMIDSLELKNVQTLWARAEEIQKKQDYAHAFDAIVARSVSNLSNLWSWGKPFLKNKNSVNVVGKKTLIERPSLITLKGGELVEEEILAKKKFPHLHLTTIPMVYSGSEQLQNLDRKLIIATAK